MLGEGMDAEVARAITKLANNVWSAGLLISGTIFLCFFRLNRK
jgi:hypothetical protein